ncbi:MAG TPA: hypothetical protein VLQ48_07565 [Chloroflexia bacterium]|nr:hypothetical protein [Chloroflexia bacterium]
MTGATQTAFSGTKEEQELAARAFDVIRRKYPLYAVNAPMKMGLAAIVEALVKPGGPMAGSKAADLTPKVEAALRANSDVFAEGESSEFITTKAGHSPHKGGARNTHTFKQRMNAEATVLDPEKAEEYRSQLLSQSSTFTEKSAQVEDEEEEAPQVRSLIGPAYPPLPTTPYSRSAEKPTLIPQSQIFREAPEPVEVEPEPAAPSTTPSRTAGEPTPAMAQTATAAQAAPATPEPTVTAPATPPPSARTTPKASEEVAPSTAPVKAAPVAPKPAVEKPQPEPVTAASTAPTPVTPAAQTPTTVQPTQPATPAPTKAAPPAAPVTPARPVAPPAPVVTGPVEVSIPFEDGTVTLDLNQPIDTLMTNQGAVTALSAMIKSAVDNDTRLITFGADIFPEEATERFSKGDYRRIKEYLEEPETGGVASDRDIIADVLGRRVDDPSYERLRFSLDYRLLKEKKDFEFVGIDSERLWVNANTTPVLPPTNRKPAEIGQDYRYLEDPTIIEAEQEDLKAHPYNGGPLEYSLSYYEYEYGVLPYDLRFKQIFPGAVFEDQRASLLRFEVPQLYGSLLAELRYPTGNRGGFIMGLSELFTDHMIAGAKFMITPTDRGANVFEVHFTHAEEVEANLLQLDERKGRWVFRPVQYAVGTDPNMLLTQEKFGKLHNQKKLEDSERRKPDLVISNAFEAIGEENDGKLWAILDDLYPVVNIERPISRAWLRTLLSSTYPFFYPDETTEGAYFYDAGKK